MVGTTCPTTIASGKCTCTNTTNGVTNYWGGNECQTCGLVCQNQGKLDTLCTTCTCPAGITGPTCNLFYALIQIQLTGLPSTSFTTASLALFSNLLASDIAYALGLPSAQVKVTSATVLSASSLQVQFQLISTTSLAVQSNVAKFQSLVSDGSSALQSGQASYYISASTPPQDVTYGDPSSVTLPIGAVVGIAIGCAIVGAVILAFVVRYVCQMKLRRATMMAKATTGVNNTTVNNSFGNSGPRPPPPRNVQVSI